jgi:hypothetical protein
MDDCQLSLSLFKPENLDQDPIRGPSYLVAVFCCLLVWIRCGTTVWYNDSASFDKKANSCLSILDSWTLGLFEFDG